MCVFSSGPIFECHWNLISQRHSEKEGEVSQGELLISTISPNNTALYWLCCFMCPDIQTSMHVCILCDALLKVCTQFSVAVRDFFPPWLCWFEFLRMEWQQDKCTELWRTNRVNCPSQNAKPIICKMTELRKRMKTRRKQEKMCVEEERTANSYIMGW